MRHRGKRWIFFPFIIVAVTALLGLLVMELWNNILPAVIRVKTLTYWQATGLLILCKILFGSFRAGSPGFRKREGPWKEKLMNMSEEQRAQFRNEWRARRSGSNRPPTET